MGNVTIYPTGVLGYGKQRYYPQPIGGESPWGYAIRISFMVNPATGDTYFPRQILGAFVYAEPAPTLPEVVDRFLFPEDYWTQAEVDRRQRIKDDQAHGFPGGTGPVAIAAVDLRDAQFLNWLSTYSPKYKDAWLKLVNGTWEQIIAKQRDARGAGAFDPETYDGKMQQATIDVYGLDEG